MYLFNWKWLSSEIDDEKWSQILLFELIVWYPVQVLFDVQKNPSY